MRSPVYWHPVLYHCAMKLSYRNYFEERYSNIGALIPEGASVTEVCIGDAYLYRHYLSHKNVRYTGLDFNELFIQSARSKNINAQVHNLSTDTVPVADYVIIQASLYQFIPNHHFVINKLLDAAKKELIISEPVINLGNSSNPVVSFFTRHAANPGNGPVSVRFTRDTFHECLNTYKKHYEVSLISSGLEILAVIRKKT